jgi:hypothetical protein
MQSVIETRLRFTVATDLTDVAKVGEAAKAVEAVKAAVKDAGGHIVEASSKVRNVRDAKSDPDTDPVANAAPTTTANKS